MFCKPVPLESNFERAFAVPQSGFVKRKPGRWALPSNRLMGMCRWMGSHFHDWIDYNGVAFSIELLQWGRIFSRFGGNNILTNREFVY